MNSLFDDNHTQSVMTDIIDWVKSKIKGRIADERMNTFNVMVAVKLANGGDHLEIGTMFGGSAICAALVKKAYRLSGKIYCIDPMDGYYYKLTGSRIDGQSNFPVTEDIFKENLYTFDVNDIVSLVKKESCPFPEELISKRFSTAYIDGWHWDGVPLEDWHNTKVRTSKFVVFDNCDSKHPDVVHACDVASREENWREFFARGITYIVERIAGETIT